MASLLSAAPKVLRTSARRFSRPVAGYNLQQVYKLPSSTLTQGLQTQLHTRRSSSLQAHWSHQPPYTDSNVRTRPHSTQPNLEQQETLSHTPEPDIHPMYDSTTGTFQYIVADPSSCATVIIDPVLEFDPCTSSISTNSADAILSLVQENKYTVKYILETHAHADHLSAASYLQAQLSKTGVRPQIGIGHRIDAVQKLFSRRYDIPTTACESVFDRLFSDGEVIQLGALQIEVVHLPGHTPDHVGYLISSNLFCGDSLFHPSIGTARTDFPGGSASDLWSSAQKMLALHDDTRIWTGHDYPPEGRDPVPVMTVKQHKELNRHVGSGVERGEFLELRRARDEELGAPRLLHQSLQINVRGGRLPEMDNGGQRMLRVPLRLEGESWQT